MRTARAIAAFSWIGLVVPFAASGQGVAPPPPPPQDQPVYPPPPEQQPAQPYQQPYAPPPAQQQYPQQQPQPTYQPPPYQQQPQPPQPQPYTPPGQTSVQIVVPAQAPPQPLPPPQPEFVAPPPQPQTKVTGDLSAGVGGLSDTYGTHFLLDFSANERIFTPIWYGGWIRFSEWLFANEYIPYSYGVEGAFALGPRPFRFVIIRVEAEHDQSLQLWFRGLISTLPTFEGDVDIGDNVVLSYQIAPLEFTATHYDPHLLQTPFNVTQDQLNAAETFAGLDPAVSFRGRLNLHVKPAPNLHVVVYAEYARQWSSADQLVRVLGGIGYGILEDAIVFWVRIRYDDQQLRFDGVPSTSAFYATIAATLRF